MISLPAAKNDRETMKTTIKEMMNIPLENIIECTEASYDQLNGAIIKLRVIAQAKTRSLLDEQHRTGILTDTLGNDVNFGVKWEKIRDLAMKPDASDDYITIELDTKE